MGDELPFEEWLAQQRDRDDRVGDVARFLESHPPKRSGFRDLVDHVCGQTRDLCWAFLLAIVEHGLLQQVG
jgi:hypothetical protein